MGAEEGAEGEAMSEPQDLTAPDADESLKPLTEQQEKFCLEFMKDLNRTQAAIRAGYAKDSARMQGSRLMTYDNVAARIEELCQERAERTKIDADYVLTTIRDTVERCRQAEPVMEFDHDSKTMIETGEYKFEHSGVLKGCELLGKHLKLFTDKHELSGPNGKPIQIQAAELTDEQLEAELEKKMAKVSLIGRPQIGEAQG